MAERVHPGDSPPQEYASSQFSGQFSQFSSGEFPIAKSSPPPGTYVVHIPKDQIYRVPPPENTYRFEHLSRKKPTRNGCRVCICSLLAAILVVAVLAGITAGVLYLVFRPEALHYSIEGVSIRKFNLTSKSEITPEFDVTVKSKNPNNVIGFYFEKGSAVDMYHDGVKFCTGELPAFYQKENNVTSFKIPLTCPGLQLTAAAKKTLTSEEKSGAVPFTVKIRAPIKVKFGVVKTWKMTVKVNCEVVVDKLTALSEVVNHQCGTDVDLW